MKHINSFGQHIIKENLQSSENLFKKNKEKLKYIIDDDFKKLYDEDEILCKMITKLRDSMQHYEPLTMNYEPN